MKKKLLAIKTFTLLTLGTYAQVPADLPSGVVAWFPFSNSVVDETGNSTNINVVGDATFANDRSGNASSAMTFMEAIPETSIISGYIEGQNASLPFGTQARTIAGWYRAEVMPEASHTSIFSWGAGSTDPLTEGQACAFFADKDGGQLFFWSAWNDVGQNTAFTSGTWHHFAMSFDGAYTVKFYVDGTNIGSQTLTSPISTVQNGNVFRIAKSSHQNDFGVFDGHFRGALDDIGVWNRELSASEVTAVYNSQPEAAGINELTENHMVIFPNPANDVVQVTLSMDEKIEILDVSGNVILTTASGFQHELNVAHLQHGIYIIRSSSGKTKKLIK